MSKRKASSDGKPCKKPKNEITIKELAEEYTCLKSRRQLEDFVESTWDLHRSLQKDWEEWRPVDCDKILEKFPDEREFIGSKLFGCEYRLSEPKLPTGCDEFQVVIYCQVRPICATLTEKYNEFEMNLHGINEGQGRDSGSIEDHDCDEHKTIRWLFSTSSCVHIAEET